MIRILKSTTTQTFLFVSFLLLGLFTLSEFSFFGRFDLIHHTIDIQINIEFGRLLVILFRLGIVFTLARIIA